MKFDVIVGNPPYQESHSNGTRKDTASNLWTKVIEKSLELSPIVTLVVPPSWLSLANDCPGIRFATKYKKHFRTINVAECSRHFNVGSNFSYFTIDTTKEYTKTDVILPKVKMTINFQENNILPYNVNGDPKSLRLFFKRYTKYYDENNSIGFNGQGSIAQYKDGSNTNLQKCSSTPIQNGKYYYYSTPAINKKKHNPEKGVEVITNNYMPHGKYERHNIKHPAQHIPKVMVSLCGDYKPVLDINGELGYSEWVAAILCKTKNEAKLVYNYLLNPEIAQLINKDMKYAGSVTIKALRYLKSN